MNILKEAVYKALVALGCAGPASRNRTIISKKDKHNCPKRQRKQNNLKWEQ